MYFNSELREIWKHLSDFPDEVQKLLFADGKNIMVFLINKKIVLQMK